MEDGEVEGCQSDVSHIDDGALSLLIQAALMTSKASIVTAVICGLAMGYMVGRKRNSTSSDEEKKRTQKTSQPHKPARGSRSAGVCVVTGGSRGIGAAICLRLASDGFAVAVNYRSNSRRADEVVSKIKSLGGKALAVQADIAQDMDVARMFEEVAAKLGPVTACVNNAGVLGPMTGLCDQVTRDQLDRVMATNFYGAFFVLREAAKRMSTSRGGQGGAIVNISAGSAVTGLPLAYGMSKGALNSMTAGSVAELARQGIRLNTVSPGPTYTDMMADFTPDEIAQMASVIPMGRPGNPSEIAAGVSWLLSDDASFVAGANLRIAGGKPLGA